MRVLRSRFWFGVVLALILAAPFDPTPVRGSPPVQAGGTTIRYGESVLGQISHSSRLAFFFARAERGDVISITMRRASGNLDPQLVFATAEGGVLVVNDDDPRAPGTLNAAIRDYTILKSDLYLIQASGYGDTTGSFTLSIAQIPPEELGKSLDRAHLIDYGMIVSGILSADRPTYYFRFHAEAGDAVTTTARSDEFSPTVTILDSSAVELARVVDSAATGQTRIPAFGVPASGAYTVTVGGAHRESDDEDGPFELQLSGRAAPRPGQALPIDYGDVVSGLIANELPAEEYIFQGHAGDVVRILMERASGDLDALVTLYDQERKQIAFDDDGGGEKDALIDAFTLPYEGPYILGASRYQRGQGLTSGAYILRLERIGPGE